MRKIIMLLGVFAASLANAGTAYFDGVKANSVLIGGVPAITNITVEGTNYSGSSVTLPAGPQGPKGDAGSSGTNFIGYTFSNVSYNINITTNYFVVEDYTTTTNINITQANVTNYVYATNSDPLTVTGAVYSAGSTPSVVDRTLHIGTNNFGGGGSGGTYDHAALTNLAGSGSNHVSAAEAARIPPALTGASTGVTYALSQTATNAAWWRPVYQNNQGGLSTYWNYSTNFLSVGTVTNTWIVPVGVPEIYVKAWGAGGGGGNTSSGAQGGYASTILKVTGGDTVTVVVATGGATTSNAYVVAAGGWPGGGSSGYGTNSASYRSGGGGYSAAWLNGVLVIVAAGGGGGGSGNTATTAGAGGAATGASASVGGGGGGQASGGTGTASGTYLQGGSVTNISIYGGGGGGGGYYGGGAGASASTAASVGSGGGGSCYVRGSDPAGVMIRGNNSTDPDWSGTIGAAGAAATAGGEGFVKIYWYFPGQ